MSIFGKLEVFGLEEVAANEDKRRATVTCISNNAFVYFIKRDEFVKSVNLYKFGDLIL